MRRALARYRMHHRRVMSLCRLLAVAFAAPAMACSGSPPASPGTVNTPTARPSIVVTSVSVSAERRQSGYAYYVVIHLKETAGAAATIGDADVTLVNGGP